MTRRQKRDLKNMIINILSYIIIVIIFLAGLFVAYLALDFLGLIAWVASGQVPEGGFNTGFYFGRISYIIITSLI